jgi:hypothetical protein
MDHKSRLNRGSDSATGPVTLLHRVLPPPAPFEQPSLASSNSAVCLDASRPGVITLRPWLHSPKASPCETRQLLRRVIAAVSPQEHPSISTSQLEVARRAIWGPKLSSTSLSFAPGAGVAFEASSSRDEGLARTRTRWLVHRQRPRFGDSPPAFTLSRDQWLVWDHRFAFRLGWDEEVPPHLDEDVFTVRAGTSAVAKRWSMPVVVQHYGDGHVRAEEVVVDLSRRLAPPSGIWRGRRAWIEWQTKSESLSRCLNSPM